MKNNSKQMWNMTLVHENKLSKIYLAIYRSWLFPTEQARTLTNVSIGKWERPVGQGGSTFITQGGSILHKLLVVRGHSLGLNCWPPYALFMHMRTCRPRKQFMRIYFLWLNFEGTLLRKQRSVTRTYHVLKDMNSIMEISAVTSGAQLE
jgi:hypothetical protein